MASLKADRADERTGLMLECGWHARLLDRTAMLIREQLQMMAFEFVSVTYKTMLVLFLDKVYMHISMVILRFYVCNFAHFVVNFAIISNCAVEQSCGLHSSIKPVRSCGLFLVTP